MNATDLTAPLGRGVINLATLEKILSRPFNHGRLVPVRPVTGPVSTLSDRRRGSRSALMRTVVATRGARVRRRPE